MPRGRPVIKYTNRIRTDTSKNRFLIRMVSLEATLNRDIAKILSDSMFAEERAEVGASNSLKWQARARASVVRELRFFAQEAAQPTFRQFAPERDWGSERPPGGRRQLLRDTIEAVVQSRRTGPELTIKSGWWAKYTTTPRGSLPPKPPGKAYKIVLPGGVVIYRRFIGPATTRAYSTGDVPWWEGGPKPKDGSLSGPPIDKAAAKERMEWPLRAWKALRNEGAVDVLTGGLVEAILHGETGESAYTPEGIADFQSAAAAERQERASASASKKLSQTKAKVKKETTTKAKKNQGGGGAATEIGLSSFDEATQHAMHIAHNAMQVRDKQRQVAMLETRRREYEGARIQSERAGASDRARSWAEKVSDLDNKLQHLHQEIATLESGI